MPSLYFSDEDSDSDSGSELNTGALEATLGPEDADLLPETELRSSSSSLASIRYPSATDSLGSPFPREYICLDSDEEERGGQGEVSTEALYNSAVEVLDELSETEAKPTGLRGIDHIRESQFVFSQSQYEGFESSFPQVDEKTAVQDLLAALSPNKLHGLTNPTQITNASFNGDRFVEFGLSEFSIFTADGKFHQDRMRGLQWLPLEKPGNAGKHWYFDGVLTVNNVSRYVHRVPFKRVQIGGYSSQAMNDGDSICTVWIQSMKQKESNIYYRLTTPSSGYRRYHLGFVWSAGLAKYFVDYCTAALRRGRSVSIHNFRNNFARWIETRYGQDQRYKAWFKEYDHTDFRRAVAANIEFLFKEAVGNSQDERFDLQQHSIWGEVKFLADADNEHGSIKLQPLEQKGIATTVVTPYVYECFSHMKFGKHLKMVVPSARSQVRRKSLGKSLHLTVDSPPKPGPRTESSTSSPSKSRTMDIISSRKEFDAASICVGDVIAVPTDKANSSLWKDEPSKWKSSDECWFALVQAINVKKNKRTFTIIWLYRPSDTTCAKMKYPHDNELFLSDHCNCDDAKDSPIVDEDILCKVSVTWHGSPKSSQTDFFIRQTYLIQASFITTKEEHKRCIHLRDAKKTPLQQAMKRYRVGDTVLVMPPSSLKSAYGLEPAEIKEFVDEGAKGLVVFKRLRRRRIVDGEFSKARPNELIYTEETFTAAPEKIYRKCLIRFYTQEDVRDARIPTPYDRDGTGDAFYITSQIITGSVSRKLLSIDKEDIPSSLIQGFDPAEVPSRPLLRGMDLYCGGGNYGRGLEEGGMLHNEYAVDLNKRAVQTYFANLKDSKAAKLWFGSVDDLLAQALKGNPKKSPLVPLPGDVDLISAGSPCPGFSLLNFRKNEEKGTKNQSLIASVAAYVDFYRPKYGIFENVISMAAKGEKNRGEDVLSQLICCFVGMGYQVSVFNLDAWSFGSPQSRSRLFVSITAPGLQPMQQPQPSHSHPPGTVDRGLGKMANNQSFGIRQFGPTPLAYMTALEATDDLEDIGDAQTDHCVKYPDHRMSKGLSAKLKAKLEAIPLAPFEMNFAKAWNGGNGVMTKAERSLFPHLAKSGLPRQATLKNSRAWGRLHPQKLFPTIATAISPECARVGRCLHWEQQRLMTVMEARRAQSFPDDEVLLGGPTHQWKIIGNSVARSVALALGLALRDAWLHNYNDGENAEPVNTIDDGSFENDAHVDGLTPPSASKSRYPSKLHAMVQAAIPRSQDPQDSSSDSFEASDRLFRKSLGSFALEPSVSRDGEVSSATSSFLSVDTNDSPSKKRTFSATRETDEQDLFISPNSSNSNKKARSCSREPKGEAIEPELLVKRLLVAQEQGVRSRSRPVRAFRNLPDHMTSGMGMAQQVQTKSKRSSELIMISDDE